MLLLLPVIIPVGILLTIFMVGMIDSAESNSLASLAKLECYHCGQETEANQRKCKHCGGELQ